MHGTFGCTECQIAHYLFEGAKPFQGVNSVLNKKTLVFLLHNLKYELV